MLGDKTGILDVRAKTKDGMQLDIHFIEIPKFNELRNKNLKKDKLQGWLIFLRDDISEETLKELIDMDKEIKKAEKTLEYLSSDPKTIELYRAREKALHERANMISSAKEEGIKQGIKQGIERGEQQKEILIVKNLLSMGMDTDFIAKASGLDEERIEEIKRKLN
ncbi:Rpn family recombination-promoting nuclease/putative transposase [Clostridium neuense]